MPELERRSAGGGVAQFVGAVTTLESELDPFVLRRLDGEHFVLFRKVWLNGARLIQGAVIAQNGLIEGIVAAPFRDTALSQVAELLVAYKGDVIGADQRDRHDVLCRGGAHEWRAAVSDRRCRRRSMTSS